MAEDIKDLYKAFILKKLTVGAVLAYQYYSTEPPILEYWRLGTENSHCPFSVSDCGKFSFSSSHSQTTFAFFSATANRFMNFCNL